MNNTPIEILKVEISKLSLSEGDYLVFKFSESESITNVKNFIDAFRETFPKFENQVMAFIGDVEISIIHKDNK